MNGDIRYVIRSGDSNEDLWLDSHLGDLYIQRALDYERKTLYELEVVALDLGNPSRTDTASVTVTITDINDNSPQVADNFFFFFVQSCGIFWPNSLKARNVLQCLYIPHNI